MRRFVYACDRCKTEVEGGKGMITLKNETEEKLDMWDLCEPCFKDFSRFLGFLETFIPFQHGEPR